MAFDISLVALPWAVAERPSAALGALAAYLRAHGEPTLSVVPRYEYAEVAHRLGARAYASIAAFAYEAGESLYAALVYPERKSAIVEYVSTIEIENGRPERPDGAALRDPSKLIASLDEHLDELVDELAGRFQLVGLTTSFGQLFGNIALARRLKERSPETMVVLGGASVSSAVGPSVLSEYPFIDFIVQGEGERPLLALGQALASGATAECSLDSIDGLLTTSNVRRFPSGAKLSEVQNMDDLPLPTFDEYVTIAERSKIAWLLPVEGSRGCWWDRVGETKNPKQTCYFCNLNVQWSGYREKSVDRVIDEVSTQVARYRRTEIFFLDNIIRHKGLEHLASGLRDLNQDLDIFYEMRANVRPAQLLALWEAGLTRVQFGIEALSTSMLRRIGKGTTTIQNLEAMKTAYELDIPHGANLIVGFPLSTEDEVRETERTIRDYAWSYEPLARSSFGLGVGSTVDTLPTEFGIANVRNSDRLKAALPPDVWNRVRLLDRSFDQIGATGSWARVEQLLRDWKTYFDEQKAKQKHTRPLFYSDGGTFLRIHDRRIEDDHRELVLRGRMRDVYLYCTEVRSLNRVVEEFAPENAERQAKLAAALDRLVASRVMFTEGGKVLSLAPAQTPQAAARRIRALAARSAATKRPEASVRRLPVVTSGPAAQDAVAGAITR